MFRRDMFKTALGGVAGFLGLSTVKTAPANDLGEKKFYNISVLSIRTVEVPMHFLSDEDAKKAGLGPYMEVKIWVEFEDADTGDHYSWIGSQGVWTNTGNE